MGWSSFLKFFEFEFEFPIKVVFAASQIRILNVFL